ncbi:hypothetical protein QJS04_geneDACA024730 [Acorus gramineus]|uniref:Uncharacterized protein n=1 Tax=Acorus gramineus TaxID=55184 RepID=A0AAV9BMF2_ACOGR|nr:hypothetical protein QJS04_geneDACA024730 [Acorus gramineus]
MQQVHLWEATMRGKLVGGRSMTEANLDLLPLKLDHSVSASLATGASLSRASRPSATQSRGRYARAASSMRGTPAAPDALEVQSSTHLPPPSQPSQDVSPTQPSGDDDTPRYNFCCVLVLVEEMYICKEFMVFFLSFGSGDCF